MYVLFYGFETWKCTDVILAKTNTFTNEFFLVRLLNLPFYFELAKRNTLFTNIIISDTQ
jgi:hypothetical protein